jgi:hypothetical protein
MAGQGALARRRVSCRMPACSMLLTLVCIAAAARMAQAAVAESPIGVHSMLYLNTPFSAKDAMFREAAALGASEIRLDIALADLFPTPEGPPDWQGVDEYMLLAHHYRLRVLANLLATPSYMIECPAGTPADAGYRCPPANPTAWGRLAGQIAAHTRGVIDDFEIINEPDGTWAFLGTPEQYAAILAAASAAIHRSNSDARVAIGGLMDIGAPGRTWMDTMLASLRSRTTRTFDIANIHVRTQAKNAGPTVERWRRYFSVRGFSGPLWVTETGYPADPSQQTDPAYQGGAPAQARYLASAIPAMICAGASKVFITERDSLTGRYASEGVLQTTDPLTAFPQYTRRPSFYSARKLAEALTHQSTTTRMCAARRTDRPRNVARHKHRRHGTDGRITGNR